jgi:hypothetical protein
MNDPEQFEAIQVVHTIDADQSAPTAESVRFVLEQILPTMEMIF